MEDLHLQTALGVLVLVPVFGKEESMAPKISKFRLKVKFLNRFDRFETPCKFHKTFHAELDDVEKSLLRN